MRKLINWCKHRWFLIACLFLLAFIPLYPKLPLVDIKNTWVYIRAEDFVVLFLLLFWGIHTIRTRRTLATPLTMPILLFWGIGALATLHSILLIFPTVSDIYPNVSFLSFVRRMEYMSLFFVAYSSVRDKRTLPSVVWTVVGTLVAVSLYGIGQKYLGFPAFLTMNEEFAKGIPIQLSALSRVSSTFGGHYDLAAYLVLVIPIVASMLFGFRNWFVRGVLALAVATGVVVLFMTVSRISFIALVVSLFLVVFFQRRKLVLTLLPLGILGAVAFLVLSPSLLNRFGSTIKTVDVLVDASTGRDIGHVKEVPNTYFKDKIVKQQFYMSVTDISTKASPSAALVIPYENLPKTATVLVEPTAPTGEDLPSGTGYINLPLSPDVKKIGNFLYEPTGQSATTSANVYVINGEYLIKRAAAYDLSFTTRFQGEWPRAMQAFRKNVLFGSGYGSVSLAVDNSYLRMLAEVGALGFAAFASIFLLAGLFLKTTWSKIDSPVARSFVLGFAAGVVGLMINAVFIDVFEASKVAFVLWLLMGLSIGVIRLYRRSQFRVWEELSRAATSSWAVAVYLAVAVFFLYSPLTRNYFIGDDFTWFRWAAQCGDQCGSIFSRIVGYFTQAGGFFYRPGTKLYFLGMYNLFWLNQTVYHIVSLVLHFAMSFWVYLLARRVFGRKLFAFAAALLFVSLTGFSEAIFWVSATGFLITANGMILSLLSYISWRETGKGWYAVGAGAAFASALMFHELAVVTPLLYVLYEYSLAAHPVKVLTMLRARSYQLLLAILPIYGLMRYGAHSHWLSGDYNYNLVKLPLNIVGNTLGYALVSLTGPSFLPVYELGRAALRTHIGVAVILAGVLAVLSVIAQRTVWSGMEPSERRTLRFASGLFFVSLIPFVGLGNMTSRYSYLAASGMVFLVVFGLVKLYQFLRESGRDIAVVGTGIVFSVFVLWHVVVLQTEHHDWYQAGEKVRQFAIAMDDAYENEWATQPMQLYFVNVPIRYGDSWVFPVGLSDALWFVFRNPEIRVYMPASETEAFHQVTYGSTTQKVFVFDQDGKVSEVKMPAPITP